MENRDFARFQANQRKKMNTNFKDEKMIQTIVEVAYALDAHKSLFLAKNKMEKNVKSK